MITCPRRGGDMLRETSILSGLDRSWVPDGTAPGGRGLGRPRAKRWESRVTGRILRTPLLSRCHCVGRSLSFSYASSVRAGLTEGLRRGRGRRSGEEGCVILRGREIEPLNLLGSFTTTRQSKKHASLSPGSEKRAATKLHVF